MHSGAELVGLISKLLASGEAKGHGDTPKLAQNLLSNSAEDEG